jgi:hypothetical protein
MEATVEQTVTEKLLNINYSTAAVDPNKGPETFWDVPPTPVLGLKVASFITDTKDVASVVALPNTLTGKMYMQPLPDSFTAIVY